MRFALCIPVGFDYVLRKKTDI